MFRRKEREEIKMPKCTNCSIDLEYYDTIENVDVSYSEVIVHKTYTCPICNRYFKWEEVYKFSEKRKIKEG